MNMQCKTPRAELHTGWEHLQQANKANSAAHPLTSRQLNHKIISEETSNRLQANISWIAATKTDSA